MVWGIVFIWIKGLYDSTKPTPKKLSTMSVQTLTLNCLACHILAKHPQLPKQHNFTATKSKYQTLQANQSATLGNNKLTLTTKPVRKNQLNL